MLAFSHVTAGYGGPPVLQDVCLRLAPRRVTTLVGPNGCGKSTLLRAAARQLPLSQGGITLDGQPIGDFSPKAYARRVALLPQARDVPAITVRQLALHGRFPYLGFPRTPSKADHAAVDAALEAAGVAGLRDADLRQLSGGQRQKAYLAMALSQDAELLLLDEPTTFLDIQHQLELLALIAGLSGQGKTVLMVLHDLDQALRVSDEVAVLQDGRLAFHGAPEAAYTAGILQEVFQVGVRRVTAGTPPQVHYVFSPLASPPPPCQSPAPGVC